MSTIKSRHDSRTRSAGSQSGGRDSEVLDRRIVVDRICKTFDTEIGPRQVLHEISFAVGPGDRLAVLGRNGAGKSTLIQILSGRLHATSGTIHRGLDMSWPLALGGGFDGELTGYDNVRFISKIYGAPVKDTFAFVDDFTEIGKQLFMPMRFYSSGMRMRVAFALSLAIDFECFLIDEVLLVGDMKFQEKCKRAIFDDKADRAMILAIHGPETVKEYCTQALVLKNGHGRVFDDVALACDIYTTL